MEGSAVQRFGKLRGSYSENLKVDPCDLSVPRMWVFGTKAGGVQTLGCPEAGQLYGGPNWDCWEAGIQLKDRG